MEIFTLQEQIKHLVVKSNKLIEAKYKLTLNEQRLILLLISLIKPEDEEFKKYLINLNDLKELLNIKTNNFNTVIKETIDNLITKLIVIKEEDGELRTAWLSQAKYFYNKGCVSLSFAPDLKPYLLQLKKHFTAYHLTNVFQFKSNYSIRIYELLLKEYNFHRRQKNLFIFKLSELKEQLGIKTIEYNQIVHFKSRILNPAYEELKEKSDLYFEYECIKTGRAITDIQFAILIKETKTETGNKKAIDDVINITPKIIREIKQGDDEITKKLKSWGTIKIDRIREKHSDEVLLNAFDYIDFEVEKKRKENKEPIKNLGAYFVKILPNAGEPFEFTKDYNEFIKRKEESAKQKAKQKEEQERQQKAEEIKRQQREEENNKINAKIEDLKLNYPEEWEAVEKEVRDKVSSELKPPTLDKEEKEIIKSNNK
jgi:plasmid replication initiation protein